MQMPEKKLLIVFNPNAGHGKAGRTLAEVEDLCRQHELDADLRLTQEPGHATEIVKAVDFEDFSGVVAAGGDGTVFEVVNGCFRNPAGPVIPFGVLPVGTGNSFARDLDLKTGQVREALDRVARAATRRVDVGNFQAGTDGYHFLNILGAGFVSDVTATAVRLKALGSASYTVGVVYQTAFLSTFGVELELDGKVINREATFVEISNSRYTADFLMAPAARIDDGLLDVTLVGRISRRRLLKLFPTVFRGEHIQYDEVETFTAQSIRIVTNVPKVLTPDGEIIGSTPAEVRCLHRALEVFC
jgi:YegS/Rv2252/BmrU family lipid kinase